MDELMINRHNCNQDLVGSVTLINIQASALFDKHETILGCNWYM